MSLINCEVLVEPQVLYDKASTMGTLLSNLKTQLESVDQTVKATEVTWKGEAADLYRNMFYIHSGLMEIIIARLEEHPTDLIEISGVYTKTEIVNNMVSESLPSDVIV